MLHGAAHDDAPPAGVAAIARHGDDNCRLTLPRTALFCCSPSTCNPYDMFTSRKSHIVHSLTTHLQQCSPIVLGLTLSRTRNVIIRLWPEQCRGCSLLDIMEAGRNKCIMLLAPAWFYFGPAAWCNECILYSPIFGGLPQAQRGKRNVRGVKFLSRKSSRSKFQFHQR